MSSFGNEHAGSLLAALIDAADDAIASKDLRGIVQSWNQSAENLFGYSAAEIVGQPMTLIIPEDRRDEEEMILKRIRQGEKIDHFRTVRCRKDGSSVDVSLTISPILNDREQTIGAFNVARDIADRVQAEAVAEHLAAIVQSSDDAIVSKNLNGVVLSWNQGAEQLFGYSAEEMIGKPISLLLPADRQDEEVGILARIRRGDRVDHFETVRVRKDGSPINVSVTISPIRDGTGRVVGASKVARDISERKMFEAAAVRFSEELETRVKDRTAELEVVNHELEAFTYSIAHDIRAPLRAIVATSAILDEEFGASFSDEIRAILARQVKAANHLAVLVDDLLTYARLSRAELRRVPVDLSAMGHRAAALVEGEGHQFSIEEGLTANGDPNLLQSVIQNLFDNAAKFSPGGGRIGLGNSDSAFFVCDEGIGFDMVYAEKIFTPFERLVRHEEFPGTGIGLASVKRVVEKHGGTCWATSAVGEGTTISFTLPK